MSFRVDWAKRSFVFGGYSAPNRWYIEHAKDAEPVTLPPAASTSFIHEIN